MKSLILENKNIPDSITISNEFLDKFMPEANGEFVKIYLYLIRCISDSNMHISISILADKFNHTENDVIRALRYWEKVGLISLQYDSNSKDLIGISILPSDHVDYAITNDIHSEEAVSEQSDNTLMTTALRHSGKTKTINNDYIVTNEYHNIKDNVSEPIIVESIGERFPKPTYNTSQLKQFSEKEDLSQLLYIAQKYLGKTLTSTETNSIIYFYETLKFPSDLVEYLIEYCVSREHKSMRYIEKVALSWADAGIHNVSQAKKETSLHTSNIYSVMKAFGISNRNPGIREQEYINKWNDVYCFDSEIIVEACNRTIQVTHQPSFEYADSILTKWKEKNITRLSELKALDEQHALSKSSKERLSHHSSTPSKTKATSNSSSNKFNNFPQRNYDFDELEKQLIGNNK